MNVLGVNTGHDSGVALIRDGVFVEIINEERFSRFKGHQGFPTRCVEYIKRKYEIDTFDRVVVISASGRYATPLYGATENRQHRSRKGEALFLKAILFKIGILPLWRKFRNAKATLQRPVLRKKIDALLRTHFPKEEIVHLDHHLAHAWSTLAFVEDPSDAVIVTLDGEGDGLCGSINRYVDGSLQREVGFPAGVGIGTLYGKVTEFLGMRRNEHEFKVMGLAPYAKQDAGNAVLRALEPLISFDDTHMKFTAAFHMQYAKYYFVAKNFFTHRFDAIAHGVQQFTEQLVLQMVSAVVARYSPKEVYFAGGVFMNIKLNQRLSEEMPALTLAFTPSAGDESLSIGAAKFGHDDATRKYSAPITSLYLGTEYTDAEINEALGALSPDLFEIQAFNLDTSPIEHEVARLLAEMNVVGRFKGRMEWGARALGNRSILANPSDARALKDINEMIKNRDFWMPFSPTLLPSYAQRALERSRPSPFMALGFNTTPSFRNALAAAIHPYDFTCRPQILEREQNPAYFDLISRFEERTGIGGVLNTSFNLHGSPIVETPHDAIEAFTQSGLRYMAIGNYLVSKRSVA